MLQSAVVSYNYQTKIQTQSIYFKLFEPFLWQFLLYDQYNQCKIKF